MVRQVEMQIAGRIDSGLSPLTSTESQGGWGHIPVTGKSSPHERARYQALAPVGFQNETAYRSTLFFGNHRVARSESAIIEVRGCDVPDVDRYSSAAAAPFHSVSGLPRRANGSTRLLPPAASLPTPVFRPQLAARVGHEELAGIEPMIGGHTFENGGSAPENSGMSGQRWCQSAERSGSSERQRTSFTPPLQLVAMTRMRPGSSPTALSGKRRTTS